MRKSLRRRQGHMEFLVLLCLVTIVWVLVGSLIVHLSWEEPPRYAELIIFASSPAGLLGILGIMFWGIALSAMAWGWAVERPASLVQLGYWQYPKRRVFFAPKWLVDRTLLTLAAVLMTFLTTCPFISDYLALSILQFSGLTGMVMLWVLLITWCLAAIKWQRLKFVAARTGVNPWSEEAQLLLEFGSDKW